MKVIEHLDKASDSLISFEIIPPKRGGSFSNLEKVITDIAKYNPPFIDVTSHAAVVEYIDLDDGRHKRVLRRKRSGTLGICSVIQHKYGIDAIPHLLCTGFTREETEDLIIDLNYLGIDNVLAIRGDMNGFQKPIPQGKTRNEYAADLVNQKPNHSKLWGMFRLILGFWCLLLISRCKQRGMNPFANNQITDMNKGIYLTLEPNASPTDFCIGVAGYPEKHFESPNIEVDIHHLKKKIDAGASYVVSQLCYDNQKYFNFIKECNNKGIDVPIIPGIKIITAKSQLLNIPKTFHVDIPYGLYQEIMESEDKHVEEIGVNWAVKQARELLNAKVPAVHFYIMQSTRSINEVMKQLYK